MVEDIIENLKKVVKDRQLKIRDFIVESMAIAMTSVQPIHLDFHDIFKPTLRFDSELAPEVIDDASADIDGQENTADDYGERYHRSVTDDRADR